MSAGANVNLNKQPEARENVSDRAASFLKKSQRKIKAMLD